MAVDLEKIQDSPHLLDLLLQIEDVLDSLDIYCFKNWFKGEIVEGPSIRRYWLNLTLKYPFDKMPDPRAGLRLLQHGIRVEFERSQEEQSPEQAEQSGEDTAPIWLVHISMPRRLVAQIATSELDFYDDDMEPDDMEDVEDAKESGMDDENEGYEDPDSSQSGNGEFGGEGGDMGGDMGGMNGPPR